MEKEQIQLYFSFHSHVKSSLIRQISNVSLLNLQIGCNPKDIHSWDRHYNNKLYMLDRDEKFISEMTKRFKRCKIKKDFKFEQVNDYFNLPKSNNIFIPDFASRFPTAISLESAFCSISNSINVGGYFVGTIVDGESVLEVLAGNHFYKNCAGFVKKLYFDVTNKLSHSIKIGLPNKLFLNERTIEIHYLGYRHMLQTLGKKYNLELVFWKKYHQYDFKCKQYTINEYRILLDMFSSFMFKKIE